MIRGRCKTNWDEGKNREWPTVFTAVPRVGERVQARCGYSLKVVQVTHTMRLVGRAPTALPFIVVELHRGDL